MSYIYTERFKKNSLQQRLDSTSHKLKENLLLKLGKSKWVRDTLELYEYTHLFNRKTNPKSYIGETEKYSDITLKEIVFFEAIEIDQLASHQKKILGEFAKNTMLYSKHNYTELVKNLDKLKDNLNTAGTGPLFTLDLRKQETKQTDLIDFVTVTYIKTFESYFLLKIKIKPSQLFAAEFKEIISHKDSSEDTVHFNSFLSILKRRKFISHYTTSMSRNTLNIRNLLADLQHQVRTYITSPISGIFNDLQQDRFMPMIEYYVVDDMNAFQKDHHLSMNFARTFDGPFSNEDGQVKLYFDDLGNSNSSRIQLVKQKGHARQKNEGKDHTDYDAFETELILRSISFFCVFQSILSRQDAELVTMKRDVYDFIGKSTRPGLFNFSLFKANFRYIRLKARLTKYLLLFKRFKHDFSPRNLHYYTESFDLEEFTARNPQPDEPTLKHKLIKRTLGQIKSLNEKTLNIADVFKSMEELNSYRTNLVLQATSIIIAFLALVFAFAKAKNFLWHFFQNIFN